VEASQPDGLHDPSSTVFDHYLKGAPKPDWMEKGVPYLEREKTALAEFTNAH
jgi:hypothetical protein